MNFISKQTVWTAISLFVLCAAIWWMSANVVWLGDDLDYKYMMKGEIWQSWGKIKTLKNFIDSQLIHYHHVNGRFVAHSIVQLFNARLGQQAFAACNAIIYTIFAILIGLAGKVDLRHNPAGIVSAVCLSVLCFITKMMPTCQIGYIWGMLANIVWLSFFYKYQKPRWWTVIVMSLFGIIVGNWQESVSIGVCVGLGIWWIVQLIQSKRYDKCKFDFRRSWMLTGYIIGTATNCLAPSTIGRVSGDVLPFSDQLLIALYSIPAIVILFVALINQKDSIRDAKLFSFKNNSGKIPNGVLVSAMLSLIVFNAIIGVYSNRQLFGANLFAAILTLRILPKHRFSTLINAIACLVVVAYWSIMAIGITEVKLQYNEIARLHSESSDGTVHYNRQRIMTLGFPLRAKYYEDILGQFDNDLHHSMLKDFKQVRKGRTLKLTPTTIPDAEKVEQYAPGHFNVTLKEPLKGEAPREVIVYGHYPILFKESYPRRIEVTKYSRRRPPFATTVIIPEFPFFTADSVIIVPNNE
ncbi:MAG: hypothetical protein K2N35_08370 [Muribaculaceae bacterium]|nr:hypothetical protein [Muribaculaceae bacterium]